MKRKAILWSIFIFAFICIAALCVWYFYPQSFQRVLQDSDSIMATIVHAQVQDGVAKTETQDYPISADREKQQKLIALLKEHSYRRTLSSPFSQNSMHGEGNNIILITVYNTEQEYQKTIQISETGEVFIENHVYRLNGNAVELLEKIERIAAG